MLPIFELILQSRSEAEIESRKLFNGRTSRAGPIDLSLPLPDASRCHFSFQPSRKERNTMSKNRSKWAIGFVLVLAFCTSVYAKGGHWTYLGDSHVDGSVDHDSIKVGRSDGIFPRYPIAGQRRRH